MRPRSTWLVLAAAAVVALGGCQLVFGLDPIDENNPPIPDGCHGPFVAEQVPLTFSFGSPSPAFFDPALSADADELWFTATESDQSIYVTRRAGDGQPYSEVMPASFATSSREYEASLTLDGRLMFFLSDRGGNGDRLFQVSRVDREGEFGTATQPILSAGVGSIELSADGLTLYFSDGGELYSATRSARDQPFGEPAELGLTGTFPTVTADELEIIYQDESVDPTRLRRAVRTDKESPFLVTSIFETSDLDGIDPEVSADGTRLIFGPEFGGGFSELRRSCP